MMAMLFKVLMTFGTKLLIAIGSESMVEWVFFKIANAIVTSTKNPHDNEWLEKVTEAYYNKKAK